MEKKEIREFKGMLENRQAIKEKMREMEDKLWRIEEILRK